MIIVAAALLAGCYAPAYRDCEVTCESGNGCPAGLSCESGMCRVSGHGDACGSTGGDGGTDGADGGDASAGQGGVTAVAAHGDHTCALCGNGSVWCWGANQHGEVSGPPINLSCSATEGCNPAPTHVALVEPATLLALGGSHSCAVHDTGKLACWGLDTSGQFGNAMTQSTTTATDVGGTATVVAAGAQHTCVVNGGGTFCAGANNFGQLGDGSTNSHSTPQKLATLSGANALFAGDDHTCALVNSLPFCWGDNDSGQVAAGSPSQPTYSVPHLVGQGLQYSAMALGTQFTCGLMLNSDLQCWGRNSLGQFGTGTAPPAPQTLATVQSGIAEVAAGGAQMCTIGVDSQLRCSGDLLTGETDSATVIALPPGRVAKHIAVGTHHACAVLDDASVACWGKGDLGQLGTGATPNGSASGMKVPVCQ